MIFDYASGTDFLICAEKEHFDLAFLDIYMGNENGMDTAKALRRFDEDCLIVFTTTSHDHALDGVGLQSVRHTAEKNGGYCRFHYGDGMFCVNVILQ